MTTVIWIIWILALLVWILAWTFWILARIEKQKGLKLDSDHATVVKNARELIADLQSCQHYAKTKEEHDHLQHGVERTNHGKT